MTPCERFKQKILDLIDGELEILQKKEMENHLKSCKKCNDFYNRMYKIRSYLKKLTPVKSPESFHILLRERIRRELAGKANYFHFPQAPTWKWATILSCGLIISILGFRMLDQKTWQDPRNQNSIIQVGAIHPSNHHLKTSIHYITDDVPSEDPGSSSIEQQKRNEVAGDTSRAKRTIENIQDQIKPVKF